MVTVVGLRKIKSHAEISVTYEVEKNDAMEKKTDDADK